MAKVPDLGSDFAQKLLRDLRRRRERLGFDSAAAPRARDAYSNAQKPPQVQKPQQQAAPRSRVATRSEAQTSVIHRQGSSSSSIARPGTPRRHDAPAIADSHAIVPLQGGRGGKQTAPAASAGGVDVQMALALALSNSGKLQNVHLVARQGAGGSAFFGEPCRMASQARRLLAPGAHVGKVAIGVQNLNDILVAYSSGGAAGARTGSVEIGKQLLRGAMDLEESLNMLMMLQDATDYMEMGSSGNDGKVLLLEGTESWKSSAPRSTSSASARLVEIVDDDSGTEQADDAKSPSDTFMQIVPHGMSQSYRRNHISPSQLAGAATNCKGNATSGEKDGSKVRMPGLIAKLMGLENLPSAKTAAERKETERFVKPEAVPRKSTAATVMAGTLPIRIIASERMPSRGQLKNFQTREWNISLTKSEEPVLSSRFSHLKVDKQTRQTMRQMLNKQEGTERRASVNQVADEKIVHQDTKLAEDSNQQKTTVSAVRKMSFLQRFRKTGKNKPATEEKATVEENKQKLGKKQTTSTKQRDSEVKPRKTREKFNKENLANPGNKTLGNNGKTAKTDQTRRQAQSKPSDKQVMEKKVQSYRRMQSETAIQNLEQKRPLKPEPAHSNTKEKLQSVTPTEPQNGEGTKVDDTRSQKPSDNTPGDDGVCEQSAAEMEDSGTKALPYQSEKELTEEINDPITAAQDTPESIAETNDDSTVSEAIQTLETFPEEGQQQQMKEVNDESTNGLDHLMNPSNPNDLRNHNMDVVSCDSFTENQLLLAEMLLKDPYLLETTKAITGFHVPASAAQVNTGKWLDEGNRVLSDIGREVIRRKGKRMEAMVDVSATRAANLKLRTLDDLVRELDSDIQSLHAPRKIQQRGDDHSTAENLRMVLRYDMEGTHSDANSVWDFGWNRAWDLPVEKNEVVRDLEKNILGGIITDVARELIDASMRQRHGLWVLCL